MIFATIVFAADAKSGSAATTKVSGFLVDVACATENAQHPKPDFGAKHGKSCLTMEDCEKSGYAVLTNDNKVVKFDAEGNKQAAALIKKTDKNKDWRVTVTGELKGDTIAVSSMELQQ
jgi:DMSO/TMAO reductase YedYZ molybdopterin-dependent catalytic subunit